MENTENDRTKERTKETQQERNKERQLNKEKCITQDRNTDTEERTT